MPYLGNQHIVGDSVNNFKVLDDISTHTATFDGSASSVVSTANETIKILNHRFVNGQRVTYNNGGGSNIGGLTSGTAYYVIYDTAHTIKLATNSSNAASLTAINLSGVGGGASHTLNVAFDGVNTKFRITHSSGNRPRFHHATQLSIAINNVIQKPNNDLNFTEGYAVEVRDIIVFKTAPTVNDIFFGSLMGETRGTFDITDHKIDRFTADGTTTIYDLTQNVPNNESLLVTLNGVVQHPTTGGVTGSYNIVSGTTNKLQFTTAPASGVDIQIRHLGFAGASSGEVSGFYGRTGNVGLNADDHITTGDITSRNINASGIVTAASFSGAITGNVTGNATGLTGNPSISITDLNVDGHTNLDNVSVAGVTTFSDNIRLAAGKVYGFSADTNTYITNYQADSIEMTTGGVERFELKATPDGNSTILTISDDGNHGQLYGGTGVVVHGSSGARIKFAQNSLGYGIADGFEVGAYDGGAYLINREPQDIFFSIAPNSSSNPSELVRIRSTGNVTIHKDLDVDGHTNLDNVSIAGVATVAGNLHVGGVLTYEDVTNVDSVGLITARKGIISSGVVTATSFSGDGSNLTGVSGFATALSNDQSSSQSVFFKTPKQVNVGAGESIVVQSDATSGNLAFCREDVIHVSTGATMRVATGTQLRMNILNLF